MIDEKPDESRKRTLWLWFAVPILCAIVMSSVIPILGRSSFRGGASSTAATGKAIVPAIRMFAGDHGGRMPEKLEALFPDYLIGSLQDLRCRDTDYYSPRRFDWLYFTQPDFNAAADDDILLASSNLYGLASADSKKFRVVIRYDGSSSRLFEPDYQRQITTQLAKTPHKP